MVIPTALILGFALPAGGLIYLRAKGLDEWMPKKPLVLSVKQKTHLAFLQRIDVPLLLVSAFAFAAIFLVPVSLQTRPIGWFLLPLGLRIMSAAGKVLVQRQARFWHAGVIRGVSPIVYGLLLMLLGGLIACFGFAGAVLPFGFFA